MPNQYYDAPYLSEAEHAALDHSDVPGVGGGGGGLPPAPVNQQGILLGANVGGDDLTLWYAAERGQLLVGHESAGWVWVDPGSPGDIFSINNDGDPEWTAASSGALASDNRFYYYVDPASYAAINSGDLMPQDWTFYDDISYPGTGDPNTVLETGVMIAQAGWYAIHGLITVFFNGAGRLQVVARQAGMAFGRQKVYKPSGMDAVDTELAASVSAVVYVEAETQISIDADVSLPSGTWGLSAATMILHRLG